LAFKLTARRTAEGLLTALAGGSKAKELPDTFCLGAVPLPQEASKRALAAKAAPAKVLGKDFIIEFV
jgi:hypothetical protein